MSIVKIKNLKVSFAEPMVDAVENPMACLRCEIAIVGEPRNETKEEGLPGQ